MQQPPQAIAAPQLPPPLGRGTFLWGCGMNGSQPMVRVGERWISQGELLRHRFTACQEIVARSNESLKIYSALNGKGPRALRNIPDVGAFQGAGNGAPRLPLLPTQCYATGPATHHNAASQASMQQGPHIRTQPPIPSHNSINSTGPPPSVPQSHLTHTSLAGLPQHPSVSGIPGGVSGPPAGIPNTVAAVLPPGTSPGTQGPTHEINVPAIPSSTPGSSVHIPPSVTPGHNPIMYTPNPTPQQGPQQNHQHQYYPGHQSMQQSMQIIGQNQPARQIITPQNYGYVLHPGTNPQYQYAAYSINPPPRHPTANGQPSYSHQLPTQTFYQSMPGVYYPPNQGQQVVKHGPAQREKKKIAIKDPLTGKEIDLRDNKPNEDAKSDKGPSPQQSRESSARNTPAPRDSPHNAALAAEFAMKVASAAASDKAPEVPVTHDDIVDSSDARTEDEKETCGATLEASEPREKIINKIENKLDYNSQSHISDSASCVPDYNNAQLSQPHLQQTVHASLPPQIIPQQILYSPQQQMSSIAVMPTTSQGKQNIAPSTHDRMSPDTRCSSPPSGSFANKQTAPIPGTVHQKYANLSKQGLPLSSKEAPSPQSSPPLVHQAEQIPPQPQQKSSNAYMPAGGQVRPQTMSNQKQQSPPGQLKQQSPPPEPKAFPSQVQSRIQGPPQINLTHGPKIQHQQNVPSKQQQQPLAKPQPQVQQPKPHQQTPPPAVVSKMPQQAPPAKVQPHPVQPKQQVSQQQQQQQPVHNPPAAAPAQAKVSHPPVQPKISQKQASTTTSQGSAKTTAFTTPQPQRPAKQKNNNNQSYSQVSQGALQGKVQNPQGLSKAPQNPQSTSKPANVLPKNASVPAKSSPTPSKGQNVGEDIPLDKARLDSQKTQTSQQKFSSPTEAVHVPVSTTTPSEKEPESNNVLVAKQSNFGTRTEDAAQDSNVQRKIDSRESSEESSSVSTSMIEDRNSPPKELLSAKESVSVQSDAFSHPPEIQPQQLHTAEKISPVLPTSVPFADKELTKMDSRSSKSSSASPVPNVKRASPEMPQDNSKFRQSNETDPLVTEKAKEAPPAMKTEQPKAESSVAGAEKLIIQYDRSFLLKFQKSQLSLKRPESLPNLEVVLDGPVNRSYDRLPKMSMDFTPNYLQSGRGARGQMQFMPQKTFGGRNSQTGKRPPKIIDFSPSGVSLKKSENAWKPPSKSKDFVSDEKVQTEMIVKKVRGILNKLTPDNFSKLVNKVKEISFSNFEQFDEVITLVFEKAVSEQGFSEMYAKLCYVLASLSITSSTSSAESCKEKAEFNTKFKNLIIIKCQQEFENENSENTKLAQLAEELKQCKDPDQKAELKANYDFEETKLRKKSVGNIRFIGELYKLKMLTSPIMMRIIGTFLDKRNEESLECLCKLLQTIGKLLDASAKSSGKAQVELNKHFKTMQDLVTTRKTSSRVRFLMMNVIDMRRDNWTPKREDAKPKTKAEVHEDIKKEEFEASQILNAPRRVDDHRERKRSRDNRVGGQMDDQWTMVNNQRRVPFDSSRLMGISGNRLQGQDGLHLRPNTDLGWGSGSSGGFKEADNRFALLQEGYPEPKRPLNVGPRLAPGGNMGGGSGFSRHNFGGSKSMPPPSAKPNQFNRNLHSTEHSKSSSRSSSRDSSLQREVKTPPMIQPTTTPMNIDEAVKLTTPIIEEYLNAKDRKEAKTCIEEKFDSSSIHLFVQSAFEWVLDKDSEKRKLVGQFFQHLFTLKIMSAQQFINGAKPVIEMVEDFAIDIPQVTLYVGEIFAPLLIDSAFPLSKMVEVFEVSENKKADLTANLIKAASNTLGSNKVSELWSESKLNWNKILPTGACVKEFIDKHNLGFLNSLEGVQEHLYQMLTDGKDVDAIYEWIKENVQDVTDLKFIRALVTAVVESQAIKGPSTPFDSTFEKGLKDKIKLIKQFVDNKDQRELQCIYALQAMSERYQHPSGFLDKCFNSFYDTDTICEDAFFAWLNSKDPEEQVGKGVCLVSARKFIKWLEEAEAEEAEYAM